MGKWKITFILFITLLFSISFASASDIYNDLGNSTTAGTNNNIGSSYTYSGFSFNASSNYILDTVQVYVSVVNGDTGNIDVSIMYSNASQDANGTKVGSATSDVIAASSMSAGNYYNFSFSGAKPTLIAGQQYFYVFTVSDNGAGTYIRLGEAGSATGAIKWAHGNAIGGISTFSSVADINIKSFGSVATVLNVTSTLNSPSAGSGQLNSSIYFNATGNATNGNLSNATLYLYNSSGLFNKTTVNLNGTLNSTNFNVSGFNVGTYTWSILICGLNASTTQCSYPDNRTFTWGYVFNSNTYNTSTYETAVELFRTNITIGSGKSISSAIFYYNGTNYTGTSTLIGGNEYSLSHSLVIPLITGATALKNWFWSITFSDGINVNQSVNTQATGAINFSICGSAPQNIQYLNLSFKDESNDAFMSGSIDASSFTYWLGTGTVSKSLTYSNTASNTNYTFCFSPQNRTIYTNYSIQYSNTSYPQRTFVQSSTATLTNSTTNKILYLLGTANGIYTSIQLVESSGVVISGVDVTIERQINGVWVIIGQSSSGSDGLVTFWVNPNYQIRITASKTNYVTNQVLITPSQSLYTLTMATSTSNATYSSDIPGLSWAAYPSSGRIDTGLTNFNITVTSLYSNLENCKFDLVDVSNGNILSSTTSFKNSTYCYLEINYTTVKDNNLFGKLSVDTTATSGFVVVDADWKWIVVDIANKNWRSIPSFFSDLGSLGEFGEGNEAEFSKIVFFFLLATILLGVFTYFTGFESTAPGISLLIIWVIVLIGSVSNFLAFDSGSDNVNSVIEQYGFLFIYSLFALGFMIDTMRRNQ